MNVVGPASSLPVYVRILGECNVRLWGLTSRERLRRQLADIAPVRLMEVAAPLPADGTVVILSANRLYDQRTLQDLLARSGILLRTGKPGSTKIVAGHVAAGRAAEVEKFVTEGLAADAITGLEIETPKTLSSAYLQKLLKSEPPVVSEIDEQRRPLLERHLFDGSYKGVTDFITKWAWPAPARAVVRLCVRLGIRPNPVTLTSLVLVLATLVLFARGWFGTGLLLGWIMTFLDTVDGKLARVTVDASAFGHGLDKTMDLIHPPLWYIAWGIGAAQVSDWASVPPWLFTTSVAILVGYIVGRLLEGSFDFLLGKFPIYSWRPIDSYARLIIARRNPCLLLLTAFWITGHPIAGMQAVAWWTGLSTVFLAFRIAAAAYYRLTSGPLTSWLQQTDTQTTSSFAARTFGSSAPGMTRALESSG